MSARTFAEWQAYCAVEPFGPPAEFWRAGVIAATLANVHRKKGQQPFKPEDFMPKGMLPEESAKGSAEHTAQVLRQNFEAYAARQQGAA